MYRLTGRRFTPLLKRHSSVPIPVQVRRIATFRKEYEAHVAERAKEGIPPAALSKNQANRVCQLLTEKDGSDAEWLKYYFFFKDTHFQGIDYTALPRRCGRCRI